MEPSLNILRSDKDVLERELSLTSTVLMSYCGSVSHNFFVVLIEKMCFLV